MPDLAQPTKLPFPWKTSLALLRDAMLGKSRSFRSDSAECLRLLPIPPIVLHPENIPLLGPALLVMNHYSRPGFGAWWIAMGISAQLPKEVHWMMTTGWNHAGVLNPVTRWLLPRLAMVYGFTVTPPMPPDPNEVGLRVKAVREMLWIAKNSQDPMALAPEGRDHPGGVLGKPPLGAGRFLIQLSKYRERITPIGVYEDGPTLYFHFGPSFNLEIPAALAPDARDSLASRQVMEAISRLIPYPLRGVYA